MQCWISVCFLQSGLALLEGTEGYQQSMDPHSTEISSWRRLFFASSSEIFELTNSDRNIGAKILNSTAPSSSRSAVGSCRSNLIIFDTSKQPSSYFPGSTSIHSRRYCGNVTVREEDIGIDVCFGLAAAIGFQVLSPMSSMWSSVVSSDISVASSIVKHGVDHDLEPVTALMVVVSKQCLLST